MSSIAALTKAESASAMPSGRLLVIHKRRGHCSWTTAWIELLDHQRVAADIPSRLQADARMGLADFFTPFT